MAPGWTSDTVKELNCHPVRKDAEDMGGTPTEVVKEGLSS